MRGVLKLLAKTVVGAVLPGVAVVLLLRWLGMANDGAVAVGQLVSAVLGLVVINEDDVFDAC